MTIFTRPAYLILCILLLGATAVARGGLVGELGDAVSNCWDSAGRAVTSGDWDLYLSGYTYHASWSYDEMADGDLNSKAWGFGVGRSVIDRAGDRHSVYVLGFEDSFHHGEFHLGYVWLRSWPVLKNGPEFGLGVTAFLFARHDMQNYTPYPGLLPVVTLGGRKFRIYGTFVPRVKGFVKGDTAYFFMSVKL